MSESLPNTPRRPSPSKTIRLPGTEDRPRRRAAFWSGSDGLCRLAVLLALVSLLPHAWDALVRGVEALRGIPVVTAGQEHAGYGEGERSNREGDGPGHAAALVTPAVAATPTVYEMLAAPAGSINPTPPPRTTP